ncbi:hypothetical protein CVV65_02155 [Kyrpidia spormannii]|uniref:Homeodomain phBC6A51-type domain-containing protein n=1 Tax=Kyrpidia spormannii TaxID=2055160 RepID=A0A2K8N342_9BACL|nr:phBC6A51 family helix-turn-helix protein [Kyrpidia spormannii]ATY83914.1 hypothetical protein CVV65_02155 [Kyrpidia spormannii]
MDHVTKADRSRQLSIEQLNAIDMLVQGKSDREVAEAVGVARQTVTEWRNRNPAFMAELNRRRQEVWGAQAERLRHLVARAVDVLEQDLEQTDDPKLRQSAAVHILRCVGLYGANLEPTGPTDPEDIERREAEDRLIRDILRVG